MQNETKKNVLDMLAERTARGFGTVDEAQEWNNDLSADINYMIPFPGLAQDIQQWILDTSYKKQPALAFAATLTVLSVVYGRSMQYNGVKGNLMFLCLADSGEGKDWPMKAAKKILDSVDMQEHYFGQIASGAALVESVANTKTCACIIDEVGHYFAGINSKNSNQFSREIMPIMTEIYTSASDMYIGKTKKGAPGERIVEPNLAFLGMSTEKQIMDTLTTSEVADGSLARFMVLFGGRDVDIETVAIHNRNVPKHISSRLELLKRDIQLSSHVIQANDSFEEAKNAMLYFYNEKAIYTGKQDGDKAIFKTFWYRASVKVLQMSLLIDQCQSVDAMSWCQKIVEKSSDVFIKKFLHFSADNDIEKAVKLIERSIKEGGVKGVTKTVLYSKTRSINSRIKKDTLASLIDANLVFTKEVRIDGSQKKSTVYFWKKR